MIRALIYKFASFVFVLSIVGVAIAEVETEKGLPRSGLGAPQSLLAAKALVPGLPSVDPADGACCEKDTVGKRLSAKTVARAGGKDSGTGSSGETGRQ